MASMIRMFAWWGTNRAMSSAVDVGLLEHPLRGLDGCPHGPAEDLAAFHVDVAALVAVQDRGQGPVEAEVVGEDQRLALGRLHDDGAGPVAEEDGRGAVVLVRDLRQGVGADHERPLMAGVEERDRGHEPVHETGAGRVQVERSPAATELVVDPRRGRGHGLVGRRGREHEKVDLLSSAARTFESAVRGLDRERQRSSRRGDAP